LPSNRLLLWLHYSGLQASCHNIVWDDWLYHSPVNVAVKIWRSPSSTKQLLSSVISPEDVTSSQLPHTQLR
jgi:hypothetical protein